MNRCVDPTDENMIICGSWVKWLLLWMLFFTCYAPGEYIVLPHIIATIILQNKQERDLNLKARLQH